ncbi:hypothetical protein K2P97_05890 [bacterium]|nr:hypothetical protein [bacterium]
MKIEIQDLTLSVLKSSTYQQQNIELYNSSYNLWKTNWLNTLKKLDNIENLYSEDFTRHDFFVVISYKKEAIGLCCFRKVDLKVYATIEDSWFNPWPKDFLFQLAQDVDSAIVPSWFTIHQDYRRSKGKTELNLAQILSEIMSLVTIHENVDVTFSSPRKDRSVDKLLENAGAVAVFKDITYHGVLVDLVCFFIEEIKKVKFSSEASLLWKKRKDYTNKKEAYETSIRI